MRYLFDAAPIFRAMSRQLSRFQRPAICLIAVAIGLLFIPAQGALALPSNLSNQPLAQASQTFAGDLESTAPSEGKTVSAASLFTQNCAGCHAHGGNVVRRGKNLKQKALKRYGYDNVTRISQIITHGKGAMSAYGERLTPDEIGAIAQYVLTQSESGWQ